MRAFSTMIAAVLVLAAVAAPASADVAGLFSITPAGSANYMAAQFTLPAGQALSGLQWYHNDATAVFPEVILLEGTAGSPPDLANSALAFEEIQGPSLGWGKAALSQPVTSSTGIVTVVFRLPTGEMTATGAGGGPGIGIREDPQGLPSYLSADGTSWVKLGDHQMAVDPVLVAAKGPVPTLASLQAAAAAEEPPAIVAHRTALLAPIPNPFNPATQVRFSLAEPTAVELVVYNGKGQRVRTLLRQTRPAGLHEVTWRGLDDRGAAVSSGVYYVRMVTASEQFVRAIALLR